jgi:hypothetical protein
MRKILPIVLIFFSFPIFGHQDYITSLNRKNIHFEFETGWSQFEINQKFDILLELTDSLLDVNNLKETPIYFSFDHDYTKSDTNYTFISFGQFEYWIYDSTSREKQIDNGIIIKIRDEDFKIKELLNLIHSSIININYVKTNINQFTIDSRFQGSQSFNSIPIDSVYNFKSTNNKTVNDIMTHKVYRNIKPVTKHREIDYYFQNEKFHFYNTRESDRKWNSELRAYEITETYGEDILAVDNILEIFGSFNDGHFIFIDDSSFYYIPQLKNKVIGPLTIDSINPGRQPILEYYHDNFDSKERRFDKFTLFIYEYVYYRKVLVIPDCSMVVGNYDHLESEFINRLLDKNFDDNNIATTKKESDYSKIYIFIIVALTLLLTYTIFRKK